MDPTSLKIPPDNEYQIIDKFRTIAIVDNRDKWRLGLNYRDINGTFMFII